METIGYAYDPRITGGAFAIAHDSPDRIFFQFVEALQRASARPPRRPRTALWLLQR